MEHGSSKEKIKCNEDVSNECVWSNMYGPSEREMRWYEGELAL